MSKVPMDSNKPDRSLDFVLERVKIIYDRAEKIHNRITDFYNLTFPCPKREAREDTETESIMQQILCRLSDIQITLNDAETLADTAYYELRKVVPIKE